MINIFQNIRKKIIAENNSIIKNTNYLKYALGEIVLVVIGILIALQVNNWNEKQKTKVSEQVVLKSLLKEFQYNQELLDKTILVNKNNILKSQNIGEYTGPKLEKINEKNLSLLMVGAFKFNAKYIPSLGTLFDVINSGKLSIITNKKLRSNLASFESVLDNIHTQENYVSEQEDKAHQYFLKEGNFRRHLYLINEGLVDIKPSHFPNNDFKFLENPEFENYLYLYIVASANLNKNYMSLKAKQDAIINLIQSEIK